MVLEDEGYETAAEFVRSSVDLRDFFCVDMLTVLNRLKASGVISEYVVVPDEAMQDDASFNSDSQTVSLRHNTFNALDRIPLRASKWERRKARFAVAHEIGHVYFAHDGLHFRGVTSDRLKRLSTRIRVAERSAHRFAEAFLVPARLANASSSAEDISDLFDINIEPATIRKATLERMARRASGEGRPRPNSIKEFLRDAKRKGYTVKNPDEGD